LACSGIRCVVFAVFADRPARASDRRGARHRRTTRRVEQEPPAPRGARKPRHPYRRSHAAAADPAQPPEQRLQVHEGGEAALRGRRLALRGRRVGHGSHWIELRVGLQYRHDFEASVSPDGHGEPQNGGVSIQSSKSRPTARQPGAVRRTGGRG
jgi:hypothetical protein